MATKVTVNQHNVRGEQQWVVSYLEAGKRKRSFHTSQAAADAAAADVRFKRAEAGQVWQSLSSTEREMLMLAYVEAKKRGGNPLAMLMGYQPAQSVSDGPKLSSVIDELIDVKSKAGRADRYTEQLRLVYDQFQKGRESTPISGISLADVESFLDSKNIANRSTLRSRLSTLFNFAIRRQYRPDNPCDRLETVTVAKNPIQVFTLAQLKSATAWLLNNAPQGLGWFALSTVCGLRPEEAQQTDWKRDVNFTEGFIRIEAQGTKVRQRRVVYPKAEAVKFLKWAHKNGGRLPLHAESRQRMMQGDEEKPKLREALGFEKWPKDITRHTAASYWLASGASTAHVAKMLGNSEHILEKHYKALVTKAEAVEFWKEVAKLAKLKPVRS